MEVFQTTCNVLKHYAFGSGRQTCYAAARASLETEVRVSHIGQHIEVALHTLAEMYNVSYDIGFAVVFVA